MRLDDLPSNFKTYICNHVFAFQRPVLYIDPWLPGGRGVLMHCGEHETFVKDDFKPVGLGHLLDRDETIRKLGEFPNNHYATREDQNSAWAFADE